jgi:hypothetical protein
MTAAGRAGRFAVVAVALAVSACSSNEGSFSPTFLAPQSGPSGLPQPNRETKESEKIVKLPAGPEDVNCPEVEVTEGGATARVGGPASQDVRYQFDISDTARECDPQGAQFALKIGVAGRLLIGPAGSPGAYSTTLHVQVTRDIDGKTLFAKTFPVAANTNGAVQAPFRLAIDPIVLPLTRARLDMDYTINIGLGAGGETVGRHRKARRQG